MITVLGILGSPRQGGNTELLLSEALRGAAAAGARTTLLKIANLDIAGCSECNDCYKTGECSIQDEMTEVYEAIERADRVLVASPIFFMGLPAQMKAVIDRCQAYWALKYKLKLPLSRPGEAPERYGAYIGVGGTSGPRLFDGVILTLKYFFDAIAVEPLPESYLLVRGVDDQGVILGRPETLAAALNLGRSLADKVPVAAS